MTSAPELRAALELANARLNRAIAALAPKHKGPLHVVNSAWIKELETINSVHTQYKWHKWLTSATRVSREDNMSGSKMNLYRFLGSLALASMMHASSAETFQPQLLAAAVAKWAELGANNYKYDLKVGGVFGAGKYRVEVRGDRCKSRHVGGIGLGHARFLERFHQEPTCDGRRITELLQQVQADIARGYTLTDLEIDARYEFPTRAYLDSSELVDQGWGFEVTDFEVLR